MKLGTAWHGSTSHFIRLLGGITIEITSRDFADDTFLTGPVGVLADERDNMAEALEKGGYQLQPTKSSTLVPELDKMGKAARASLSRSSNRVQRLFDVARLSDPWRRPQPRRLSLQDQVRGPCFWASQQDGQSDAPPVTTPD